MGNGNNISFWHDRWVNKQPFVVQFSRLYSLWLIRDISMHGSWNEQGNGWNHSLRRNLTEDEIKEWVSLMDLLNNVQGHLDMKT